MTRSEQMNFLITKLMPSLTIPKSEVDKWTMFRSLVNLRQPGPVSAEFLKVQDSFLRAEIAAKGITQLEDLTPIAENIYLWQGDITTLAVDAIVNAANSGMTGCYCPCHGCIDNAIHTYAGVQLRNACAETMATQGYEEPAGYAKITAAYNLPSQFVIHTVGPIVNDSLTNQHRSQLTSCYRSCLEIAEHNHLDSIAFCCISTGEFHFPNKEAAQIAINTVRAFFLQNKCNMKIIFNVFQDLDFAIYFKLLAIKNSVI